MSSQLTPQDTREVTAAGRTYLVYDPVPSLLKEERKRTLRKVNQTTTQMLDQAVPTDFSEVPTADIVADLLRHKRLHLVADGAQSIPTYEKNYNRIARIFPYLPLETKPLEDHLFSFTGKTGRTRRNEWDYLNQIYRHAKRYFKLPYNPINEDIDRPQAKKSGPNPLSWDQAAALVKTPETIKEKSALHIYLGHGWRPKESLRIRSGDVKRVSDGLIWCFGKQREEVAPILPETLDLLTQLASGLSDDGPIFRANRRRGGINEPLGEDGMRDLVYDLYRRAGITGHIAYDLRDTFSQMVIDAGCDEFTEQRLMRHVIPGTGDSYRNYPRHKLVQALLEYSPLRLLQKPANLTRGDNHKVEFDSPPSPP